MPAPESDTPCIIIPMAGAGQRFRDAGFTLPKPLIDVRGKPMIAHVIENIDIAPADLILIARREDALNHARDFDRIRERYGCEFLLIDGPTEGAACTVLHAAARINNNRPLLLLNSDQVVDISLKAFVQDAQDRKLDGSILTFEDETRHPKWSYAAVNDQGHVTETREKVAISTHATVGIYWFAKGSLFVEAAAEMISRNDRSNKEFYVCPGYNYLVRRGLTIGIYGIEKDQMHGLGTPEDLQIYLSRQA